MPGVCSGLLRRGQCCVCSGKKLAERIAALIAHSSDMAEIGDPVTVTQRECCEFLRQSPGKFGRITDIRSEKCEIRAIQARSKRRRRCDLLDFFGDAPDQ